MKIYYVSRGKCVAQTVEQIQDCKFYTEAIGKYDEVCANNKNGLCIKKVESETKDS